MQQTGLSVVIIQIGAVLEPSGLFADRFDPSLVAIAEGIDSNPRAKIDVFLAVRVDGHRSPALGEHRVKTAVSGHMIGLIPCNNILMCFVHCYDLAFVSAKASFLPE